MSVSADGEKRDAVTQQLIALVFPSQKLGVFNYLIRRIPIDASKNINTRLLENDQTKNKKGMIL